MPDNVGYTPGVGATVAADDIGGVLHQRVKIGVGSDGTAVDVSSANPMPITAPSALPISTPSAIDVNVGNFPASQAVTGPLTDAQLRASAVNITSTGGVSTTPLDPSTATTFGPITAANTVLFAAVDTANERTVVLQLSGLWVGGIDLQASQDGTTWFDADGISQNNEVGTTCTVYAPDVVNIPVTARFFRAITAPNFAGSVSGSYTLRTIDPPTFFTNTVLQDVASGVQVPVSGFDPQGYPRPLTLNEQGHTIPADGRVITGSRNGASVGPIVQLETTGYGTVALQLAGTFTGTITFQVSNDGTAWSSAVAWPAAGAAAPVNTATAVGQWLIPAAGRFFRAQITTAGTGFPLAVAVLKNFSAFNPTSSPNIAANSSVNVAQIAGTAAVSAGVAGTLAVGGNIAVGSAPTTNPVSLAWDGTNTRRILTDASSGGIVLGSSAVTNGQTLARFSQTVVTPAATQIKASAGRLTMLNVSNGATVAGFLHLYNAAAVTLGTTSDVQVFAIPANVSNFNISLPDGGLYFSTGIGAAFTAGVAANDNTAFGSAPTLIANYAFI